MLSRVATGRLTFQRGRTWQDFVRAYTVVVDGAEVGSLRPGAELSVDVDDGPHTCRATISWTGSKEIVVPVRAGTEVRILVAPSGRGGRSRQMDRAMSTDDWLVLTVVSDGGS